MLDAATELFVEFGYASTTVRMIADRAKLSVGGVFTTFDDKADILHHVRMAQNAGLRDAIARTAPTLEGAVADRVSRLLALSYAEEWRNLPLVVAYVGASHGWSGATEAAMKADHAIVWGALRDLLRAGVERGELETGLDVELAVEMIYGVYLGQYRRAWYGGWTAAQTASHMDGKLRLMFRGLDGGRG